MVIQKTGRGAATDGMLNTSLVEVDPEVHDAISAELDRQESTLEMDIIAEALRPSTDEHALDGMREQATKLAKQFPLYPNLEEVV